MNEQHSAGSTDEHLPNMFTWNLEDWEKLSDWQRVRFAAQMQGKIVRMRGAILALQNRCCGSDDLCNGCRELLGIANAK